MPSGHMKGVGCLDPESLGAFLDGRLSPEKRTAAEAHLTSCEPCYEALLLVTSTLADLDEGATAGQGFAHPGSLRGQPRHPLRSVVTLLAAASLVIAVAGGWWLSRPQPLDAALLALGNAPRQTRFSEGRVSLDRDWRPAAPVTRASEGDQASLEVRSAAQAIRALTEADSSGVALHARGLALLAAGDLDGSLSALERAASSAGVDVPAVRTDLSAARLERFRRTGHSTDATLALQDADAALATSPNAPLALFNRAAALEAMGDRTRAVAAWQQYLVADPSSAWSEEARRHLRR